MTQTIQKPNIIQQRKEFLLKMILEAGAIVENYIGIQKKVEFKGAIDLVTEADKKTEDYILTQIKQYFPDDNFIAEENGSNDDTESSNAFFWIIDPIDGTTSFFHNFPIFAVSIALVDENLNPILGAVYNPYYKELFFAEKNQGAFLISYYQSKNPVKIQVSTTQKMNHALIGTGFPYNRQKHLERVFTTLKEVLLQCRDIRRTGSAAMDICFVAMGRYDAYFEENLKIWDVAAANLILQEAGGSISQYNGEVYKPYDHTIVVSNTIIHDPLIAILQHVG